MSQRIYSIDNAIEMINAIPIEKARLRKTAGGLGIEFHDHRADRSDRSPLGYRVPVPITSSDLCQCRSDRDLLELVFEAIDAAIREAAQASIQRGVLSIYDIRVGRFYKTSGFAAHPTDGIMGTVEFEY